MAGTDVKVAATYCFVDLAGFAALTEAHGDEAAADLAQALTELVEQALAGTGRVIKTIGDAVLLSIDTPDAAVRFVSRLWDLAALREDFPVLRVGLHHGEAVEREGDVFGAAINLAARITSQAAGDEVLATALVAEAASRQDVEVLSLGAFRLRNVGRAVELFSLRLADDRASYAIDPVCRMRVDRQRAAGSLRFDGTDYWFCSLECVARFSEAPDPFVERQP